MEGVAVSLYKGIKGYYCKRRGYERLNKLSSRSTQQRVELGSNATGRRRQRFWRIKVTPKIKSFKRLRRPNKFLLWLRDAYVSMMLSMADTRLFASSYGGGVGFQGSQLKEYDNKMIIQIYNSLVVSRGYAVPEIVQRRL